MDSNTATVIVSGINAAVAIFTAWMTFRTRQQVAVSAIETKLAADKVDKKVDELVTASKHSS